MRYFDVVIALAVLFLGCAFLTLKGKLHSALAPLTALSVMVLVLTFAGVGGFLYPAALGIYVLYTGVGVWAVADTLKKDKTAFAKLVTPGALLFWGMTLFFAVYLGVRQPLCLDYDELSFWGTAAKLTGTDNRLFTTAVVGWPWQATQNPGMILTGYFFQLLGAYADWKIYLGYNALAFACYAAVLSVLENRQWQLAVGFGTILWVVPWFLTTYNHTIYLSTVYLSTYGDIPSGLVLGGAVALWLGARKTGSPLWVVFPALALCANIKSNTFVLSLVSAGLIAADYFLFGCEEGQKFTKGLAKRLAFGVGCMAAPMVIYLLWNKYVVGLAIKNAEQGGMGQTSEDIVSVAINGIKMTLGLPVGDYYEVRRQQYEIACRGMVEQFFTGAGKMSMIGCGLYITLFILAVFAAAFIVAGQKQLRLRIVVTTLLSLGGFAAYQFMLALSYGFVFKYVLAEHMTDYNRYVGTYYIGWLIMALAFLAYAVSQKPRLPWLAQMGTLTLALLMLFRLNSMVLPQLSVLGFSDSEFAERRQQQTRAAAVAETVEPGTRIFYVSQGDDGLDWFTACYDLYPLVVDYSGFGGGTFGIPELDPQDETTVGYYYHPCTPEEFVQVVKDSKCAVMYLDIIDDIFEESYGALFTDGLEAVKNGETILYRVTDKGYEPMEMEVP